MIYLDPDCDAGLFPFLHQVHGSVMPAIDDEDQVDFQEILPGDVGLGAMIGLVAIVPSPPSLWAGGLWFSNKRAA